MLAEGDSSFDKSLLRVVQAMVMKDLLPKGQVGKFRNEPVFVNDPRSGQTIYWPPDHVGVEGMLEALVNYVNADGDVTDNIIKAGVFHKQFVIIHPFVDGNGRSVRLLTKFLLAKLGLNTFQLFSFESYYNANITKYFDFVGVRGNYYDLATGIDFTAWLEYFTDGIIDELIRVSNMMPISKTLSDRLEKHHQEIIDLLERHGAIKDSDYAKAVDRSRSSRRLDFQKLIDLGMIERKGKGRGSYYILRDN